MPTFVYPTNAELRVIGPEKVARIIEARAGFDILPMRNVNAHFIQWTQRDNYFGLQKLRGLDGAPTHVKPVGDNSFVYEPGVYGEFMTVTEAELTARAGSVMGDVTIDVGDLVLERQNQLIGRELDRIEWIIWQLVVNGTFAVSTQGGVVFTDQFQIQTHDVEADWDDSDDVSPIDDFREVALLGAGKGLSFGGNATAYMNRVTANKMLKHFLNVSNITVGGGNTVINMADVNRILAANDVPSIRIYDEGYYDDANNFQRYIPTDRVVVVGARVDGSVVGEYIMTRNANNPSMAPGSYEYVKDRANGINAEKRTPPNIEVHRGHNGGPVLYHPGAIVVMNTAPSGT